MTNFHDRFLLLILTNSVKTKILVTQVKVNRLVEVRYIPVICPLKRTYNSRGQPVIGLLNQAHYVHVELDVNGPVACPKRASTGM